MRAPHGTPDPARLRRKRRTVQSQFDAIKIKPFTISRKGPFTDPRNPQDHQVGVVLVATLIDRDHIVDLGRRHRTFPAHPWVRACVVAPQRGHQRLLTLNDHSPAR
jgi:hypothetical protein